MIVSSSIIYSSIGEDVLLPSPITEVNEWSIPKTGEILAICTTELNEINYKSNRSSRLQLTTNCSLQIYNLTQDDVGIYKCFKFAKDSTSKHTYDIEIQLRSKCKFN